MSALALESILIRIDNIRLFNLSETAVGIKNIEYIDISSLELNLEYSEYKDELKKSLDDKSRLKMNSFELSFLQNEKEFLLKKLNEIEKFENLELNTYTSFEKTYLKYMMETFMNYPEESLLRLFFNRYFQTIVPFVYYHFNNKKLKNEKKKVLTISKTMNKQIMRFIKDYLKYLDVILG